MRASYLVVVLSILAGMVRSGYADYTYSTLVAPAVPGLFLGGLVADANGNLYTAAAADNVGGNGSAIVELPKGGNSLITLATLNDYTGYYPEGGLTIDGSGDLFGTTYLGGGGVFELQTGAHSVNVLAGLNHAQTPPIRDGSGNLFGTTYDGGSSGYGEIYEIGATSHNLTTLASFTGSNGNAPYGTPVMDKNGNLFGSTGDGGINNNNDGVVYEYSATTKMISAVALFNGTNGSAPIGNLIMDSAGNLYGVTETGGKSNKGTIFKVAAGTNVIQTLASFNGTDGNDPAAGLYMDSAGNLFGTTQTGSASGYGEVYELVAGSSTPTVLHSFDGYDGFHPVSSLYADANGDLFGTAAQGGVGFSPGSYGGSGTIFELTYTPEPSVLVAFVLGLIWTQGFGRLYAGVVPKV